MAKRKLLINSIIFPIYIILVWGLYRLIAFFPETVDEVISKPLLWLLPILYFLKIEKRGIDSIGITKKNLFSSIYLSLALGAGFALEGLIVHLFKYKGLEFNAYIGEGGFFLVFALSVVTAIVEEITFRGYIFSRMMEAFGEWRANFLSSFFWAVVHMPISLFWLKLGLVDWSTYLVLVFVFGVGSSFLFARTKNIFSSILLHVFWSWPIILFR